MTNIQSAPRQPHDAWRSHSARPATQAFDDGDAFTGDPGQAMQVSRNKADVSHVTGGFVAVGFTTE
jgi:hypothetical protein